MPASSLEERRKKTGSCDAMKKIPSMDKRERGLTSIEYPRKRLRHFRSPFTLRIALLSLSQHFRHDDGADSTETVWTDCLRFEIE